MSILGMIFAVYTITLICYPTRTNVIYFFANNHMTDYEEIIKYELHQWQVKMQKNPSGVGRVSKAIQDKINNIIPDKIHDAITATIKQMTRAVLFGAEFTTSNPVKLSSLEQIEKGVQSRIKFYKNAGAAEGGITGAGGFLLAMAEFPILLGIKMKLLFDIASLYGRDVEDYKERLFLLYIFQLAFSSQKTRQIVYNKIVNWDAIKNDLPEDIHQFDWKNFQQEYRDYIDLAKMAQLIPGIGAAVGVIVNYRLLNQLGKTAMNAYRMRWIDERNLLSQVSTPSSTLIEGV